MIVCVCEREKERFIGEIPSRGLLKSSCTYMYILVYAVGLVSKQ